MPAIKQPKRLHSTSDTTATGVGSRLASRHLIRAAEAVIASTPFVLKNLKLPYLNGTLNCARESGGVRGSAESSPRSYRP